MVQSRRSASLLLAIFLLTIVLELIPQEAEARRRGGRAFGRRVARSQPRRRAGGRRFVQRNNVGRARLANNNFNNNISNFLDNITPVNGFSSLNVDPTGNLQRLVVAPDFAVNRFGQVVPLNNGNILDPSQQALPFINNQVVGFGGLSAQQQAQLQILNDTGNFQTVPIFR